jgi:arylsulfatase A-like enzyme
LAELLKPLGYPAGPFGNSHLGEHDEQRPTVHGVDASFGNRYHIDAEPEPADPAFREMLGPRGVLVDKSDELGITDDTIVIDTPDNRTEKLSWPDGGSMPFRSETLTSWRGGIGCRSRCAGGVDIMHQLLDGRAAGDKIFTRWLQ